MKNLKTLGRTSWEKIKIGEIFTSKESRWNIFFKVSNNKVFYIANDSKYMEYFWIGEKFYRTWENVELYKLPKSVQNLWKG